jgi:hypothetical protein
MKNIKMKLFCNILLTILLTSSFNAVAQCTINGTCGYTVQVSITPIAIIPSALACPFGYNYNVTFNYTIIVSGINTCWNGNIGVQPQIFCNGGQNNGYYTINVSAPTVGSSSSTTTYTGTLTTATSPYRNLTDCITATPISLNCNSIDITIYGPGISTQTIPCNSTPLPIEVYTFDVKYNNKKVYINWETASEVNNDYFTVERSKDGLYWNELNTIKGAGNSSSILNYNTTDYSPLYGISYYRLKQTDFDGKYEYSKIRSVNLEMTDNLEMYPNPTNNQVTIIGSQSELKQVKIYNTLGQDVTVLTNVISAGNSKMVIDLSNLSIGMYYIKTKNTANKGYKQ